MKTINLPNLIILIFILISCERTIMEPSTKNNPLGIFDEYAQIVTEKYALFNSNFSETKYLIDSLRKTIEPNISDEELFKKLGKITLNLKDGHSSIVDLSNSERFISYNFFENFPYAYSDEIVMHNYLNFEKNSNLKFIDRSEYGYTIIWGSLMQNKDIGYIRIPSWEIQLSDSEVENIFRDLKETKALIIDQRNNCGGDPGLAAKFASYLTDKSIFVGHEKFKIGPKQNDFAETKIYLQPSSSKYKYLKEVRILIDRYVYSAATTFLYLLDPIKNIKTIGQKTGGGSGSLADGFLANGWYWSLSTSEFIDLKNRHLNDGVEPDQPAFLNFNDEKKDEIIEVAIKELTKTMNK